MADEDKSQSTVHSPEAPNLVAPQQESGSMPAVDPAAITREASNIARELRTLAHRVESFKITFAR